MKHPEVYTQRNNKSVLQKVLELHSGENPENEGIPPLVNSSADLVCDDSQKADLLNETFINQNTFLYQSAFPFWPSNTKSTFTFKEISADEVTKAVRCLPSENSNGPDKISYRLLKEAGPNVVGPLTTLFNLSLK